MPMLPDPTLEAFCQEYAKDRNGTRAYIATHKTNNPKTAGVNVVGVLAKASVQDRIRELTQTEILRTQKTFIVTKDRWLKELACIAFADPRAYFDEQGQPLPIKQLPKHVAAAIAQFEAVQETTRDRSTGVQIQSVDYVRRFRLHDKIQALTLIGKHCGFLLDKPNDDGDKPQDLESINRIRDELAARIARLLEPSRTIDVSEQPQQAGTRSPEVHLELLGETRSTGAEG